LFLSSWSILDAYYFVLVTSLEAVVLQLQDSCRESRADATQLRQAHARLRYEFREREKVWRILWQAKKSGQSPGSDDMPPLPSSFSPSHSHQNLNAAHLSSSHVSQFNDASLGYRASNEQSAPICSPYNVSTPNQNYSNQSPSLSYTATNEQISGDGSSQQLNSAHRVSGKYAYPYNMQNSSQRDSQWHTPPNGDGAPANHGPSQSPGYSPTLTSSEMSYVQRYQVEEHKAPTNNLETAPYIFSSSRSLSPTVSTPPSSSSTSLTSPFQFTFPESSVTQDRPEYDYRRHSNNHNTDGPLHAGGPDISLAGPGSDAVRYRLGTRRGNSGNRPSAPVMPHFSGSDSSLNDRGSSEGELSSNNTHHHRPLNLRSRVAAPSRSSRSPSPDTPPISGTLAVIKAQAFGALRRTRTRSKRGDGASRAAIEALEAGLGVGVNVGHKRPRLDSDDGQ
jgi:hypothetical protein